MVHIIKIALFASAAILPALAAPLHAETNELVAREPAPRGGIGNVFNRAKAVIRRVGSTSRRVTQAARRVNSAVSSISRIFGRELEPEEELFLRDLLEEFHARELEPAYELDARDLDDVEARELFDEELD